MEKIILLSILILISSGCASKNRLKELPEEKLYVSRYTSEEMKIMRRQEIVSRHSEWSESAREAILKGDIQKGMNKKQILASWGIPLEILGRESDEYAVWLYRKKGVAFKAGEVVEISERYHG